MKLPRLALAALTVPAFFASSVVYGQATWIGTGNQTSPAIWSDSLNWSGSAPASSGTTSLTFLNSAANSFSNNDLTGLTVTSLTIPANDGAVPTPVNIKDNTITGNKITLSGDVTIGTGNWQSFNTDLGLTGNRKFIVNAGQLTLGGTLTDGTTAGGILKEGGATLIVSGNASLTGVSTQTVTAGTSGGGSYLIPLVFNTSSSGTVILQNPAALGSATLKGIQLNSGGGGTLDLQTDTSLNGYGIFAGSGGTANTIIANRLTNGAGFVHALGVAQLGSATLTVNQGGRVTSGAGGVSFTALSLTAGNNDRPVTLQGSGLISIGDIATTANAGNNRRLALSGTNTANTVTGVISNLATGVTGASVLSLIKSGTGTWTLSGNNTYSGVTTIAAGTLQLGNGGASGTLNPASTLQNGGTLAINRSGTVTQGIDFAPVIAAYTTDFSSNATGTALGSPVLGKLIKSGSGNLVLNGNNTLASTDALTFTGAGSGTVTLTHTGALGAAGNSVRFSGGGSGALDLQTDSSVNAYNIGSGTFNGGTLIVNRATSGAGITHALGTLDLSSVTLTANTGSNVTSGTAAVSFTELRMSGGNDNQPVTLAGSATFAIGSASITSNGIAKRLQLDGSSTGNTIGAITDTNNATAGAIVNLIKAGNSTWTLTANNTYSGNTTLNGGTLRATTTQAFGLNSAVTLANTAGTVLDLNNNSNSIGSLSGGGSTGGNVSLGNATLSVGSANTSPAVFAGVISGTGSLVKTGNGTLALSGLNTFTGGATVASGNLTLSTGGAVGALRGNLTIESGATVTTTATDALGYNVGTKVNTVNINGGTLTHNAATNLTLSSATVNLTGGTLQSTGAGIIDIYDAQALGGGNPDANTAINSQASANTSIIAGTLRLRQGDNDATGTVFTVADGAASTDLLVSAALINGNFQGANSAIRKAGPGTLVLSGNNSYTGATTVTGGTLALTNPVLADTADVNLSTGAVLSLDYAGTDTIAALKFDGVPQAVGTWGGPASSATFKSSLLSGTGLLAVTTGPALSPYASWASGYSLGATSFSDDTDSDGIANALEWVLGGNPTQSSTAPLPVFTVESGNYVFRFTRDLSTLSAVTLVADWGVNLATWTPVTIGSSSSGPDVNGVSITVTPNTGAPDTIEVRIPTANAASGRIFVRLKATVL